MMSRRKKCLLAALPLALFLGACQATTTLSVSEDATLTASLEMLDDEGLAASGATCSDIEGGLQGSFPYADEFTVEDIGDGTRLSCRFNVTFDSTFQSMAVRDNGDTLTIDIPEEFWTSFNESAEIEQFGTITSTFILEFPGTVVEASPGGVIEGNRAVWSSYDAILGGVSATGNASATATSPSPTTPSASPTTSSDQPTQTNETTPESIESNPAEAGSKSPVWAWILIGAGVVVGIVAVVLIVVNKRRNSRPDSLPGVSNPYPGPGGPGYGDQPQSQPQQPTQFGESPQHFGQQYPSAHDSGPYGASPDGSGHQEPNPPQR